MRARSSRRDFLGRGWAFPVRADADGRTATAAAEADIEQSIRLILGTARGERVMRPDFGAGLHALVFEPMNTTTVALVRHHVEQALVTWEPRIDRVEVSVEPRPADSRLDISIRYRVRASNTFYNLVYPFYLQEGNGEWGEAP